MQRDSLSRRLFGTAFGFVFVRRLCGFGREWPGFRGFRDVAVSRERLFVRLSRHRHQQKRPVWFFKTSAFEYNDREMRLNVARRWASTSSRELISRGWQNFLSPEADCLERIEPIGFVHVIHYYDANEQSIVRCWFYKLSPPLAVGIFIFLFYLQSYDINEQINTCSQRFLSNFNLVYRANKSWSGKKTRIHDVKRRYLVCKEDEKSREFQKRANNDFQPSKKYEWISSVLISLGVQRSMEKQLANLQKQLGLRKLWNVYHFCFIWRAWSAMVR